MKAKTLLAIGLCAGLGTGLVAGRTWTSATGSNTFEGDFKSFDAISGKVTVTKTNGRSMTFSLDILSEADQTWVKEQPSAASNEAFMDSEIGKSLKELKILEGRTFKKYAYEEAPEYFILYFSASW